MLSNESFQTEDIYSNLNYLRTVGGRKFSNELISSGKNFYNKIQRGDWEPQTIIKDKNVLIIGPGKSLINHKRKIMRFIKKIILLFLY